MKTLSLYILKETILYFLVSLFSFVGILLVLRILKLTNLIVNKGVAFSQVVQVFISIVPTFLEFALPLSALLGVMLAFARLSGDSEIVVIRASGISLYQLLRPVFIFGILAFLLTLFVSHDLKPWGHKKLSQSLFEIAQSRSTAGLSPGVFNELGNMTLYAQEIQYDTGGLSKVLIDDRRSTEERKVITARSGKIISNPSNETITFLLTDGEIHEQVEGKYVLTRYKTNRIHFGANDLYQTQETNERGRPRSLTDSEIQNELSELSRPQPTADLPQDAIDTLNAASTEGPPLLSATERQKRVRQLKIEQAQRWSLPFAALLLALTAMPLGIHPPRTQKTWGVGLSATVGLLVFVVYFAMLSIGITLAESGAISALLAAWLPNIVVSLFALYAIRKMGTEKWSSFGQAASDGIASLKNWGPLRLVFGEREAPC
ncbi:MAG: LPS export ABC transporter permease LptF [Bdellovibrionales bacterium]|nr:LPS export ABC transporter permease LptF [Bdellovibrionales bacterium]